MGNTQSEVTAGAKKQADFDPNTTKIYSLVDLKKGGLLVQLMREAIRNRNFDGVSKAIVTNAVISSRVIENDATHMTP